VGGALGDVQAAHDFEAGSQRQLHLLGRWGRVHENAVNAVAQPKLFLERFNMHIAGAVFNGLDKDNVGELDDGPLLRWTRLVGRD